MKEFKKYLQTQLSILEVKLQSTLSETENLPVPQDIELASFGTKEELKKMYIRELKPNIIKRIIGPTKYDLQIHIKNKEHQRLYEERRILERQISQIKQALPLITEQGIVGEIWPNDELIKFILEYSSTRNINPKELLDFLVQLCKHSKENDKVEDKIKKNIARFFNEEDIIEEDSKLSTLILLFEKLFMAILSKEEQDRYSLVINQIIIQLRVEKDKVTKKETKPDLELQRRALIDLQDYINGTTIIKTLDTKNFELLLDTAGIPHSSKLELIEKMELKIKEENEKIQRSQTIEAMKRFLTEEEIELVRQAELKENTLIGPLKDLLHRAKKDVISMCKYLSYVDGVVDLHESLEILTDRTRVLKHVLLNIEEEQKEPNTLFYVTDKEGVPLFLRNMELHEIAEYNTFYNLLYKVAINGRGKRLFNKDDINFYYIGSGQYKVVYVETKGTRIVLGIDSLNPSYSIKRNITSDMIEQIKEIELRSTHPVFKEIHATYENVILEALNIKETGFTLSLKRNND